MSIEEDSGDEKDDAIEVFKKEFKLGALSKSVISHVVKESRLTEMIAYIKKIQKSKMERKYLLIMMKVIDTIQRCLEKEEEQVHEEDQPIKEHIYEVKSCLIYSGEKVENWDNSLDMFGPEEIELIKQLLQNNGSLCVFLAKPLIAALRTHEEGTKPCDTSFDAVNKKP